MIATVWVRRARLLSSSRAYSATHGRPGSSEALAAMLNVSPTASEADLKAAFIRRAKECHPDVSRKPPVEAKQEFILLAKAYDALVQKRRSPASYDASPSNGGEDNGFSSHEDVADFARRARARRRPPGATQASRPRSNRDVMGQTSAVDDSFVDLQWWLDLPVELSNALDFAYWGPHFEPVDSPSIWGFPYAFEAEHRVSADASDHIMELVCAQARALKLSAWGRLTEDCDCTCRVFVLSQTR
jgi:hypothetical protein